jgi:uncharacterized protein YdcH (DUF465 family)
MKAPLKSQPTVTRNVGISCLLLLSVPFIAPGQQTSADPGPDKATIQALLVEVRQLRLALERSTTVVPRFQLAVQRLQAQQERVDRLSKELRDLRSQIAQHSAEKDQTAATVRQLENELGQTQDPARRNELQRATKQIPLELERITARENQDRAQEGELMSQLQTETAKLNALADQLDALDKKLQEGQQASGPGGNQR